MTGFKIVSRDEKNKRLVVWTDAITSPAAMQTTCQYFLDNIEGLEDFMIMNLRCNGLFYDFLGVTKNHGMRKRTYEEKKNNILTGEWR